MQFIILLISSGYVVITIVGGIVVQTRIQDKILLGNIPLPLV